MTLPLPLRLFVRQGETRLGVTFFVRSSGNATRPGQALDDDGEVAPHGRGRSTRTRVEDPSFNRRSESHEVARRDAGRREVFRCLECEWPFGSTLVQGIEWAGAD